MQGTSSKNTHVPQKRRSDKDGEVGMTLSRRSMINAATPRTEIAGIREPEMNSVNALACSAFLNLESTIMYSPSDAM